MSYLGTDLVTALAGLNVHDFPHNGCERAATVSRDDSSGTTSLPQTGVKEPDNGFIPLERYQDEARLVGVA